MGCLTIYQDNYTDATVISNRFIDDYMKDANDAQLKIYLFMIRMMNARQPLSISGLADQFNHTEKDVMRSLRYWEKCGVLSLEYNDDKTLSGIHLFDLNEKDRLAGAAEATVPPQSSGAGSVQNSGAEAVAAEAAREMVIGRTADAARRPVKDAHEAEPARRPASASETAGTGQRPVMNETGEYSVHGPVSPQTIASSGTPEASLPVASGKHMAPSPSAASSEAVPSAKAMASSRDPETDSVSGSDVLPEPAQTDSASEAVSEQFSKPSYSLDQLKAFQAKDSTAQLLFIAEQYLGRPLSPSDMKSMLFFLDKLHFSDDLIDYLLQYCIERGKKDFRYIEKVAVSWAQEGITTPKDAESRAGRYDKSVYTVMNALGKSAAPTRREVTYIKHWSEQLAFEMDVILEACERTVLATDRHRFEYADKILEAWKEAGVHHKADIAKLDEKRKKDKPAKQAPKAGADQYNRFMHNSYDFDALEKELLRN